MIRLYQEPEPIVVTGIGLMTSVGDDRESTWRAVRSGKSGVRSLCGIPGIPDDLLIGAPVTSELDLQGQLKVIALGHRTADEAMADARIDLESVDTDRFGCAISGHFGDLRYSFESHNQVDKIPESTVPWWTQWLPSSACSEIARRHGLNGPRMCHITACASGLIDFISAVNAIRDNQCDIALAGSSGIISPLMASGFRKMRVLAHDDEDPRRACRPFDRNRHGFVMGEGAAMFVIERLSHARARGARIYAEVLAGTMLGEAHHLTSLDDNSETLTYLIRETLRRAGLAPSDVGYVNAHATGTQQNDLAESRALRASLGSAIQDVVVGANKSSIGHLVNAAGSVELALTLLALRDGFAPPTLNLSQPDPECDLDCAPLVGRLHRADNALKLSCAFGGHLVCVAVQRWNETASGFGYPADMANFAA